MSNAMPGRKRMAMMICLEPPIRWLLRNLNLSIPSYTQYFAHLYSVWAKSQKCWKWHHYCFVPDSWIKGIMGDDWRFIRISSQIVLPVPGTTCFWWICWPWLCSERIIECCSFSQVRKSCFLGWKFRDRISTVVLRVVYKLWYSER